MGQWAMSVWGVHKTTLKYAQMGTHVKYLATHDHGKKYMHLQGWLNRSERIILGNFGKLRVAQSFNIIISKIYRHTTLKKHKTPQNEQVQIDVKHRVYSKKVEY